MERQAPSDAIVSPTPVSVELIADGDGTDIELAAKPVMVASKSSIIRGTAVALTDIKYTVERGKKKGPLTILDQITTSFQPGRLTALMGPSGGGKTTLLDVAAGRKNSGKIEGKVLYGGFAPTRNALKHAVGYVEQFDTLIGEVRGVSAAVEGADARAALCVTCSRPSRGRSAPRLPAAPPRS